MKWLLLIVILLVVLIAFGLWRRTQGRTDTADAGVAASLVPPDPESVPPPPTPAAEAGADEVIGAPVNEARPAGPSGPESEATTDPWWPDSGSAPTPPRG